MQQHGGRTTAEGADFRTFVIHEVLENSPATDAGIRRRDIITAIDGSPAAGFTLSALGEMFEKPRTYELDDAARRPGR